MDNIQNKVKIQEDAEKAHIKIGLKSTVCASVGSGKSKIAINRIQSKFTNNKKPKIIFTGAREIYLTTFKEELIKWGFESYIKEITFCCIASLKKYKNENWDLIIVDECHIDTERILSFISNYKNKDCEILCLTGTPIGENSEIGIEYYRICPISYRKTLDNNIEDSVINDYRISIILHDLGDEKYIKYGNLGFQSEKNKYNFLYNSYLKSLWNPKRKFSFELMNLKRFFKNLKSKKQIAEKLIVRIKAKTLIYAGSIEQAESMEYPCYHSGLHKDIRKSHLKNFINGDINILINVAGIRESANIHNLKYGIIMAPDASQNAFEQTVGRFSRLIVGEKAHLFVLCAKGTIEEVWLNKAIKNLDSTKIKKINFEQIENLYQ